MWSLAYDDWDENKQGREEYAKEKKCRIKKMIRKRVPDYI